MIEKYEKGKWVKLDKKMEIDKILDLNNRKKGGERETYFKNLKLDYGSLKKGIYKYTELKGIKENTNVDEYISCIFEIKNDDSNLTAVIMDDEYKYINNIDKEKANLEILEIINNTKLKVKKKIRYGHGENNWYRIDKYEEGEWKSKDNTQPDNINCEYIDIPEKKTYVVDYEKDFGKLEKGIYRYVENVGIGQGGEEYVSDIFEII
jgi:hypothetical protein